MKKVIIALAILFAFPCSASTIPEGAIIKSPSSPDVYIVKYNAGKQYKRLVLNPLVFKSYGHLKWENLLTISDGEMNSFITSDLVRVDGYADIYQLVPEGDNGGKYQLTSTSGYDLNSIYIINSVDFGNYSSRGTRGAIVVEQNAYIPPVKEVNNSAEIEALKIEIARKEKVTLAFEQLTPIVNKINNDLSDLSEQAQNKDAEIEAVGRAGVTQAIINARRAVLISQYNAIVDQYNALLEKKKRIGTIIYELDDYSDYGILVPAADRAYLAGLGIFL